GQFPLLLCLTEGNVWLLLPCRDVVAFHGELSCLTVAPMVMPPLRQAGERRHGDESSEGLALSLAAMARRHDLRTARYDLAAEVQEQDRRVAAQEKRLGGHPAHAWRDRKRLKQKRHRLETVQQELEDRRRRLNDRIGRHWRMVLSLIDILRHFACLQELEITPAGRVVSALRGDNELWLGLALLSGHLDHLPAPELAAAMEAISTEVSRNDLWSAYPPPPLVMEALTSLRGLGRELDRQQQHHGIATPIWWEPELTGLVAAWARGSSWDGIMAKTSLDEGDVVRVVRRTMDVLAQIPHCPGLNEPLRRNARRAHGSLNRFPVREADDIAAAPVVTPDMATPDPGSRGGFGERK
ncbi:MAG: DEAD/DEAH box helicase, partial [Synechococcus sp. SB0672_bin_10]|nr:DEAD/DEAH box helicase [Synechococcus sp. SB0672_bin_10]